MSVLRERRRSNFQGKLKEGARLSSGSAAGAGQQGRNSRAESTNSLTVRQTDSFRSCKKQLERAVKKDQKKRKKKKKQAAASSSILKEDQVEVQWGAGGKHWGLKEGVERLKGKDAASFRAAQLGEGFREGKGRLAISTLGGAEYQGKWRTCREEGEEKNKPRKAGLSGEDSSSTPPPPQEYSERIGGWGAN